MSPESALDRVRRICLALPETTEKIAWGESTFRVRDRLFAMFASADTHHGSGVDGLWLHAPLGVQELLVRSHPERYFVPPYVGPKGWIGVRLDRVMDTTLREHAEDAWAMVAPGRLLKAARESAGGRRAED